MPTPLLEKFIARLQGLKDRVATESLTSVPNEEKTEFGFGHAVGRLEGIRLAENLFNELLNETEEKNDPDAKPDSRTRARRPP